MTSNPRTTSEPLIVHVGRCAADRAAWWQRLQQLAKIVTYPNLSAALTSPPSHAPRVTLLIQHHPFDGEDDLLVPWRQLFPLTQTVVMQGPWVSGRFRSIPPSDGFHRFAWHEVAELLRAVERYLHGYSDSSDSEFNDSVPACASSATSFTRRLPAATDFGYRPEPSHLGRCPIVIRSRDQEFAEALSAALSSCGWPPQVTGNVLSDRTSNPIGLFDVSGGATWFDDPDWHSCVGRIAIKSFLQPSERVDLRAQGFDNFLPKPVSMRTLGNQLQAMSAARSNPAFPFRRSE
ncbi:MAG: hypothetical protein O3C60_03085 [Planctomycetota bacterium]|nr:hypothetical protein [Planctomycetota bacterium]